MSNGYSPEQQPLLGGGVINAEERRRRIFNKGAVGGALTIVFVFALLLFSLFYENGLPSDNLEAALSILSRTPIIDGHIDLPIKVRSKYANNISAFDLNGPIPGHVDIPRLRQGKVGAFFWSVFVGCPDPEAVGPDFVNASWLVRDTLEQIDVSRLLIDKYSDTFQFAGSTSDVKNAIQSGKIAGLIGVEGGHQLGNSLAVLRQYYSLGARYVTLTHSCNNAFADSCGIWDGPKPVHNGLSALGRTLIAEMNRIGMLVDLSHTSDETAIQALRLSKAPVIWSHSSARAIHDVPRNVPDNILKLIGEQEGKIDAVVMVNFYPGFVGEPSLLAVADHIDHIGKVAGRRHVGLGSDFDGIETVPAGLEDVSKYPVLVAELRKRGWDRQELAGLAGANFLRVFEGAERVSAELKKQGTLPAVDLYDKRPDLP